MTLLRFPTTKVISLLLGFFLFQISAGQEKPVLYQGDVAHTGQTKSRPLSALKGIRFAFETGGAIRTVPAISAGMLFVGSLDGKVYAVDARSGVERWRFGTGGPVNCSPAVFQNRVYVSSREGKLYCLQSATGKMVWSFSFGPDLPYAPGFDYYQSSPTIENNVLYVGSGDGNVYAIDAISGRLRWKTQTGSRVRNSPAIAGDLLIIGTMNGYVSALRKADGVVVWKFETLGATLKFENWGFDRAGLVSSPSVQNGIVTIGCRDGFVYALDVTTGALRWKYDQEITWPISTPGHYQGKVLVGTSDGSFFQAIDLRTGIETWRLNARGAVWSSPSIAGSMFSFGDLQGNIYGASADNGEIFWRFKTGGAIYTSPLIHDGVVYCGSDDGYLYALEGSETAAKQEAVRRGVFWEESKGFKWFRNGVDGWIRDYFVNDGYERLDAVALAGFMKKQIEQGGRSVVVFAENRVPGSVLEEETERSLFRRYLNSGGSVVWLGTCPIAYRRDSTGAIQGVDFTQAALITGIQFPGKNLDRMGWYGSVATGEGTRWGLRGRWIGFGSVAKPEVSVVLAEDEFGMASCWLKNYGGRKGAGLLQLWVPRDKAIDLTPVRAAVEFSLLEEG